MNGYFKLFHCVGKVVAGTGARACRIVFHSYEAVSKTQVNCLANQNSQMQLPRVPQPADQHQALQGLASEGKDRGNTAP